jgi:preprotein translocase subunit SecE
MAAIEKIKQTGTFLEECWAELLKVTWPDFDQLRNATLVVIVFTIAISLVIWLMDSLVTLMLRSFMGLFGV